MGKSLFRKIGGFVNRPNLRIAVLGACESGKTTFITSFYRQLQNPPNSGKMFNGWTPTVEPLLPPEKPFKPFPLPSILARLQKDEWPTRTTDVSMLRFNLEFQKNKKRKSCCLSMLDIPGERVADFTMYEKTWDEWSDWLESNADGTQARIEALTTYFEKIAKTELDKEELLNAYKRCLQHLTAEYSTFVTPSIVKLDEEGQRPDFDSCPIGLSHDKQFVPLPKAVRTNPRCRDLVRAFRQSYDDYKKNIVNDVIEWLQKVDKAVYLVDVLTLLNDGEEAFVTQKAMGDATLAVFRSPSSWFKRAGHFLFYTDVDEVQLLATQGDRVPTTMHKNIKKLLIEMHGDAIGRLGKEATKASSVCAAILTTKQLKADEKGSSRLFGWFRDDNKQEWVKQDILFDRPELTVPEKWPCYNRPPETWKNRFSFPKTRVDFPKHANLAPPERGLSDVMRSLFDLNS